MKTDSLIEAAASLIRQYSPRLADKFIAEPFNRIICAHAFAAGFPQARRPDHDTDPHPHAWLVIKAAYLDHEIRQSHYEAQDL